MVKSHYVLGQTVNASVVTMAEGALVIDTSVSPEGAQELFAEAQRHGPVHYVINTHEHGDHLAGNHLFSCPIISTIQAREQMQKAPTPPALPTLVFSEEMELHLGETVFLKHFGGHCPGLSVVHFPERKLLFTGDLIFAGRIPYMGQADFPSWLKALSTLELWDVDTVVPGHGPQGGKELLIRQREWLERYIEAVLNWSSQGLSPQEMLDHVLAQYEVIERWHSMVIKSIELVLTQCR